MIKAARRGISRFFNTTAFTSGYDAVEQSGKRKLPGAQIFPEDRILDRNKRNKVQNNANDLARNYSLCGWMIRRHLDYVASFEFRARTGDDSLDQAIEELMAVDARPYNADAGGRFTREKLFRLAELRRVLDGDCLLLKLNDGKLQGIESDLVRDPDKPEKEATRRWVQGVKIKPPGLPLAYAVWSRNEGNYVFADTVKASDAIHYGFFSRFASDQVRGVSPITSALNPLRDVYENFDYALAKAKISQLFAMAFYRNTDASSLPGVDTTEAQADSSATPTVDFSKGPVVMDLDSTEKAEILESNQPSEQFQNFTQLVTGVALKALDIPYSFYDEAHANFFGRRAAWLHYQRAAQDKQADQVGMRRQYTVWKLRQWIRDGLLTLPSGMGIGAVAYDWVPRGMPWWDPVKEVNGSIAAIAAGLQTPQRVCRENSDGGDFYDNVDEIAKALEYAKQKGVPLVFGVNAVTQPQPEPEDDDDA